MATQQQPMMAPPQTTMTGPQPAPTILIVQQQRESCRNHSRIVAWVDIILSMINILCNSIVIAFCTQQIQAIYLYNRKENSKGFKDENYTVNEQEVPVVLWAALFLAIFGIVISGVEIRIAICLLSSTNIGTNKLVAIGQAKWWRGYHVFLIIFSLIIGGVNIGGVNRGRFYVGGYHFVCFVIRCLFIYIVHNFIQELHASGPGAAPMVMGGGNQMTYTTTVSSTQYQQHPSQYQQSPSQYQQQPQGQPQQQPPQEKAS